MKDIEYEKDGVKKFAQARFEDELKEAGWIVVKEKVKEEGEKSRGRPKKDKAD
jgi:hypothetical protein